MIEQMSQLELTENDGNVYLELREEAKTLETHTKTGMVMSQVIAK